MEKNEQSCIPDPGVVVSPDDKVHIFERGNNNLESSSSEHEQHQPKYTKIEIEELEEILGAAALKDIHNPARQCIYKVPNDLRKVDQKAYTPQVISIGPFHNGKKVLSDMEDQKLKYMLEFHKSDQGAEKLKRFKRYIEAKEQTIRNYYQEKSGLKKYEFVNMILLDAVFIIEFFLKNTKKVGEREFDYFLDTPCEKATITRDLQLLENQLPYFVLKTLFEKGAFHNFTKEDHPDEPDPFLILSHRFFFNSEDNVLPKPKDQTKPYIIQHFTDLRRYFLLMDFRPQPQEEQPRADIRDLPFATKLSGSGVKFKGIKGRSSLEISCQYLKPEMPIPLFKGCENRIPFVKELELQIPCLEIDDRTECLYRNLMALEQCHYPRETHICNFILLMDFLINTKKDVDFLVDQEIIDHRLGDNAAIAKIFKKIGLQITPSPSVYHSLGEKLKDHYHSHKCWNRNMATLKNVYFRDVITGTATVVAGILLVLTFIQAVCSILSL